MRRTCARDCMAPAIQVYMAPPKSMDKSVRHARNSYHYVCICLIYYIMIHHNQAISRNRRQYQHHPKLTVLHVGYLTKVFEDQQCQSLISVALIVTVVYTCSYVDFL